MTIYVFQKARDNHNDSFLEKIADSARNGKARFGWSYRNNQDLRTIQEISWADRDGYQKDAWGRAWFLLHVQKGDWIVHVSTPHYGKCIAGQVKETYNFDEGLEVGIDEDWAEDGRDFRHFLELDTSTIVEFDRNDVRVCPETSKNLKPRGSWQRASNEDAFSDTIENLKKPKEGFDNPNYFLQEVLNEKLQGFHKDIHDKYKDKKLEYFLADVIKGEGIEVDVNGSGWRTDNGADLLITAYHKVSFIEEPLQIKIVAQVKSYSGEHWETGAIKQLKTGLDVYHGQVAVLFTTAEATERLIQEADKLQQEVGKPVHIIAGADLAKFVLRHWDGVNGLSL